MNKQSSPHYTSWLGQELLREGLPWNEAQQTSMVNFLSRYSIRGSPLIGLLCDAPFCEVTLLCIWNIQGIHNRVPVFGNHTTEQLILGIFFPKTYHITFPSEAQTVDNQMVIDHIHTQPISSEIDEQLRSFWMATHTVSAARLSSNADTVMQVTSIYDDAQNAIQIFHDTEVCIQCFEATGRRIYLPDV